MGTREHPPLNFRRGESKKTHFQSILALSRAWPKWRGLSSPIILVLLPVPPKYTGPAFISRFVVLSFRRFAGGPWGFVKAGYPQGGLSLHCI